MDPRIANLPSTTFFGHRLTRRQIADIQETVALCPALSRLELSLATGLPDEFPVGGLIGGSGELRFVNERFNQNRAKAVLFLEVVAHPAQQHREHARRQIVACKARAHQETAERDDLMHVCAVRAAGSQPIQASRAAS